MLSWLHIVLGRPPCGTDGSDYQEYWEQRAPVKGLVKTAAVAHIHTEEEKKSGILSYEHLVWQVIQDMRFCSVNFLLQLVSKNWSYKLTPGIMLPFGTVMLSLQCTQIYFFSLGSNTCVVLKFCDFRAVKYLNLFYQTIGSQQVARFGHSSQTKYP